MKRFLGETVCHWAVIAGLMVPEAAFAACLDLRATGDYVDVANSASLQIGTSDLTIEAWVKTTQNATYRRLVSKGHAGPTTPGYLFDISNGKLLAGISATTGSWTGYYGEVASPVVNDDQWHHVAVVFNRSDTVGPTAYVDGTPYRMTTLGSTNWANDRLGSISNGRSVRLGARDADAAEPYDGLLDDVRVWTEARSWSEIRQSLFGAVAPTAANLSASWNFEGTLADGSPNGNNGTWSTGNNAQAT